MVGSRGGADVGDAETFEVEKTRCASRWSARCGGADVEDAEAFGVEKGGCGSRWSARAVVFVRPEPRGRNSRTRS